MPRRSNGTGQEENISGYFRMVYEEHPEWLKLRSNEKPLERWLQDHPGYLEPPDKVKSNLANIKSILKNKKKKGRRGARKVEAEMGMNADGAKPVRLNIRGLSALEEHIDDSLSLAKSLDREALQDVIDLLRSARNQVILKSNQ